MPPLPKIDMNAIANSHKIVKTESNDGVVEQEQPEEDGQMNPGSILQKVIFWSEKADLEGMDKVLEIFKESPSDQLILIKIRFEQRIV